MKSSTRIFSMLLAVLMLLSCLSITAFAQSEIKQGVAFVNASSLRLRSEPNTSSKTITCADRDEVVVVISKTGDWYKVIYNLQEGYMHSDYLKVMTAENVELGYGKVNGSAVNLRSGPSTANKVIAVSNKGDKAYIIGINAGWYKIIYGNDICYIRSDYLDLTEAPYENKASSKSPLFFRGGKSIGVAPSAAALSGNSSGSSASSSAPASSSGNLVSGKVTGQQIVNTANQYLGVPYVWGGASPSGFDCSGFVYYVLRSCGIPASRTLVTMISQGTQVEKSQLQPGDVVFFKDTYTTGISHVGIYVGGGQFIHAPHSGAVVSYSDLYSSYYVNHYYTAVRFTK